MRVPNAVLTVVFSAVALVAGGCGSIEGIAVAQPTVPAGSAPAGSAPAGSAPAGSAPAGSAPTGTAGNGYAAAPTVAPTVARSQLAQLTVAGWASMSGYRRDRFEHWRTQGEGCDTREVVLKRDGREVRTAAACAVVDGTWFSAYDGKTISDPSQLDIDHTIPLANAWRTGASQWTPERREEFANDLTRPQLVAVTAATNRSKGDQDPSQWKPPRRVYWCEYAQRWIAVKSYWRLRVTHEEKVALHDMLGTC